LNNTLLFNGCNQTSWDRGDLALVLPNSSGVVQGGRIASCPGIPPVTAHWPTSADGWDFSGNVVDGVNASVVVLGSPSVLQIASPTGGVLLRATKVPSSPRLPSISTVLRYTLDGSMPTANSSLWPTSGSGVLTLPARTVAVLVKAFPQNLPEWQLSGPQLYLPDLSHASILKVTAAAPLSSAHPRVDSIASTAEMDPRATVQVVESSAEGSLFAPLSQLRKSS
jgi:hypothetical protein